MLPNYSDMFMWIKMGNELNSGGVARKIIQKNINTSKNKYSYIYIYVHNIIRK